MKLISAPRILFKQYFGLKKQIVGDFNIYANNYRKLLKEANANSQCNQFTIQHPADCNEKACIFDSQNKTIKMLVW